MFANCYYGDVYTCRDTRVRVREQLCGVGFSSSTFYGDSRDQIQVPCFHGKCIYLPGYVTSQKLDSGAKFLFSCFTDLPSGTVYRTCILVPQLIDPNLIFADSSQSSPSVPLRASHGWRPEPAGQLPRVSKTKMQDLLISKNPATPFTREGSMAHLLSFHPSTKSRCCESGSYSLLQPPPQAKTIFTVAL